jgi:menaquinone-dependent protoporphyrinogen oxidase
MGGAAVRDLKQDSVSDLGGYDCVIIGSSVYAGRMRKEAKAFVTQNASVLQTKTIGLFLSGMSEMNGTEVLEANLPKEFVQAAKAVCLPGGIFDPKKAGTFERLIMKAAAKQADYSDTISDEKINEFVEAMLG